MSVIGDAVRESGASVSTAFSNSGLRRVMLAFGGSALGDWAYATAVTVWVYEIGGASAVGIWGALRLGLMALVTPFAAGLVDRYPRKVVMVVSDLSRLVLVAASAVLIAVEGPEWSVYVLATLAALAGTPFRPALSAILPGLARNPQELTAANGTTSTMESVAFFIGPAIGATLITLAGIPVVLALNAVTFAVSALLISGVAMVHGDERDSGESTEEPERPSFLRDAGAGFAAIWRNPDIRAVTIVYCLQTVVAGAFIVFGIALAVDLDLGPEGVGYLDSIFGVGAIVGGLLALVLATRQRLATDFWFGVLLWALPLLAFATWPSFGPAVLAIVVMGIANPVADINGTTILQRLTPDRMLGRVFGALETALIATMALGALIMPLLIDWLGLRGGLAAMAIAVAVVITPFYPRMRRLDLTLRDPEGLDLLRALPLFAPLAAPVVDRLAASLVRLELPAGNVIIREGGEGDRFYVVAAGEVIATHDAQTLSTSGPGEPFGEVALLRDVPRTATVTALTDVVLYALDRDAFLTAVTGDPEARSNADELVSRRIPTY